MGPAAVILMYHGLRPTSRAPDPDPGVERYVVSAEDFERQMQWLLEAGFTSVGLQDFLAEGPAGPAARPLGLTFDDGRKSDHRLALPVLQGLGLHATFFIVTDWIDRPGFLSRGEIRELVAAGMKIGSHTVSHSFLCDLPESEIREELASSRGILEDLTGHHVRFLALPGGWSSRKVLRIAREIGYEAVGTSRVGTNRLGGSAFCLHRIPVLRRTSLERFQRLVNSGPLALGTGRAVSGMRRAIRRAVGQRAYEGMRQRLLARYH